MPNDFKESPILFIRSTGQTTHQNMIMASVRQANVDFKENISIAVKIKPNN